MIPYGKQDVKQEDIDAVIEVLRSDWLTQGPVAPRFEQALASHVGACHGVAANSATSALHIACLALGVEPGDYVWTSAVTFVASANCALYCGAHVDFVDIDPVIHNLSVSSLERKLATAKAEGRLPKVVIAVHLCGQPSDMAEVQALGRKYNFAVIEDASHAIGAKYRDEPVGNCRYSDITVFSFHPVKIITTAEGGVATTNDAALAKRMERLRSHGITRDPALMTQTPHGPWYYEQVELGFNYRMTEIQAALGLSQLARLSDYVAARHRLAERYDEMLSGLPVRTPAQNPDGVSAVHLYVVRLDLGRIRLTHSEVFRSLREQGIGVNLHYIPLHLQPFFAAYGFSEGDFPQAEQYYSEAISLPLFPRLTPEEQDYVITVLRGLIDD